MNEQPKSHQPDPSLSSEDHSTFRGLELYPFQIDAIRSIREGHSLLVAAPTGAGKTLVADYAIEAAFERRERIVYTSPVKALSNQKFRDFRENHGDDVGIMTGDVTINATAPLLIMTTEVFRNTIFEDPARLHDIGTVIYDEIHYLDDIERGTVWEESIIYAPKHIRVIGLSATIPNIQDLADWMAQVRESTFDVIVMEKRPVPLRHFIYMPKLGQMSLSDLKGHLKSGRVTKRGDPKAASRNLLDMLQKDKLLPCLYFCFSRKECESRARENSRRRLLNSEESKRILVLYDDLCDRYQVPTDALFERVRGLVSRGLMYHHAGLMPIYKEIVERLFTSGLIRVLFATETFALGVNMPARCVAFQSLRKFDGVSFDYMKTRDYFQMAGRASRQGIDDVGFVYSLLDPRDINIEKLTRIYNGKSEPVRSRFNLDYSAVLCLYERLGERVPEAYAHSFAHFLRAQQGGGDKGTKSGSKRKRRKRQPRESRLIRMRLKVLKRLGYIEDGELTAKGRFASKINGYEVQAAELLHYGLFHLADEFQLCVLMTAIVFEERRGNISSRLPGAIIQEIKPLSEKKVAEFRRAEFESGLDDLTQDVNFGLSAPIYAWAKGADFEELRGLTNISDGDIIRNLRLTIQIMRNVRNALVDEPEIRKKFDKAMDMVNRDEVDAKRQLELG